MAYLFSNESGTIKTLLHQYDLELNEKIDAVNARVDVVDDHLDDTHANPQQTVDNAADIVSLQADLSALTSTVSGNTTQLTAVGASILINADDITYNSNTNVTQQNAIDDINDKPCIDQQHASYGVINVSNGAVGGVFGYNTCPGASVSGAQIGSIPFTVRVNGLHFDARGYFEDWTTSAPTPSGGGGTTWSAFKVPISSIIPEYEGNQKNVLWYNTVVRWKRYVSGNNFEECVQMRTIPGPKVWATDFFELFCRGKIVGQYVQEMSYEIHGVLGWNGLGI